MDRAPDGQKSFHTTLQLVTKQGCKCLPKKVDPGTDVNTIALSCYKTLFPNHFTRDGQLKKNALGSTANTWSPHDGTTKQFLGYFTIDVQHKTSPQILPLTHYVFEDISRPFTLISYPASIHLGIVEFKVPNEVGTHTQVSSVTNTPNTKNVSFNDPLHYSMPTKKKPTMKSPKKSLLKQKQHRNETFQDHHNTLQDHAAQTTLLPIENNTFQDHATMVTPTTIENSTFQDHALEVTPQHIGNNALQDPTSKYIKNKSFQDHKCSVKDMQDIISLKNAFPQSFDTTGNMP